MITLLMAACGGEKAGDKNAELEKLLKEQAKLNERIRTLKQEIRKESGSLHGCPRQDHDARLVRRPRPRTGGGRSRPGAGGGDAHGNRDVRRGLSHVLSVARGTEPSGAESRLRSEPHPGYRGGGRRFFLDCPFGQWHRALREGRSISPPENPSRGVGDGRQDARPDPAVVRWAPRHVERAAVREGVPARSRSTASRAAAAAIPTRARRSAPRRSAAGNSAPSRSPSAKPT